MTLSDLECQCSRFLSFFKLLFINEYDTYYLRCVYTWMGKYLRSLIATVFQNDRLFEVSGPTGSHIHPKSGSIKEMARDRHIVTTHYL